VDDDPLRIFAANLRAARLARGLTQESVATAAGMDMSYYGRLERAVVDPSVRTVTRVATALGVTPARLMEGVELPG
jgi:transcriptional regulator with XRE-family HTH domain